MDFQNKTTDKGITFGATPTIQPEPFVEFKGNLRIGDNAIFAFTGNGFVLFNAPMTNSWALPKNITAGTEASMKFIGTGQNDKVLEVLQEGMYPPDNLKLFVVRDGTVALGAGSRISPLGINTAISFSNARVTSTTGTNNLHRGLVIFGQKDVTIESSVFENGIYGIYTFLHNTAETLPIENKMTAQKY